MELRSKTGQRGITLIGLFFILVLVGMLAVVGLKVVPTVSEYFSIKKAIASVKASGTTVAEIRAAFDRQASVGYIDSISSKDLDIVKNGDAIEVSFAYEKKIPLFGPVSLVIDYAGSTANNPVKKPAVE